MATRERCKYTCKDLMKFVPKAERPKWRETAIDAAEGVALHSLIELLIETKELERRQDER